MEALSKTFRRGDSSSFPAWVRIQNFWGISEAINDESIVSASDVMENYSGLCVTVDNKFVSTGLWEQTAAVQ